MDRLVGVDVEPEHLARLLTVGLAGDRRSDPRDPDRTSAQILDEMLVSELPLDAALPDSVPELLGRAEEQLLDTLGRSLKELLLGATTDLAVLEGVKDYAKALAQRAGEGSAHAAATVVYYATIASALTLHDRHRITQQRFGDLEASLAALEHKCWIPSVLRDLFASARRLCGATDADPGEGPRA